MGGARIRFATSLFAAFAHLRFCTGLEICSSVVSHGKDLGCTEAFQFSTEGDAPDLLQEIAGLLHTSSTPEQLYTWLVPTDRVIDETRSSGDTLAAGDEDSLLFTRIVPILGTVPIPQHGKDVEAQTVYGTPLRLSADEFGTVTVACPATSSVAVLHATLAEHSEGSVQRQVPALNLQSCAGLVHVVVGVQEAAEVSDGSSGDAGRQVIAEVQRAAGVLVVEEGGEQQRVQARRTGGVRKLLSHLQRSGQEGVFAGRGRAILQQQPQVPADPDLPEAIRGDGGGDDPAIPDIAMDTNICLQDSAGCSDDCTAAGDGATYCTCDVSDDEACDQLDLADVPAEVRSVLTNGPAPAGDNATLVAPAAAPSPAVAPGMLDEGNTTMSAEPSPAPANAPLAAAGGADAAAERPGVVDAVAPQDPPPRGNDGISSTLLYIIIAAGAVALLLCALVSCLLCRRRKGGGAADASKPISVRDGGGAYQQSHQYDSNFSNSLNLRQAQAQPPMAVPPSPHMSKLEIEQSGSGHHPDAHYGAPVHSSGYRGAPDAFGAVSGPPTSMNNQPANGKAGEPYNPMSGAAAVGGVSSTALDAPPKRATHAAGTAPMVSATAPIAGVHANKDIKEKKKRTPDSQKRALQMGKNSSATKRGDGVQVGMPTPTAQRSKPVLAAQPLPIMASVPMSPQTQSEIASLEQKLGSFGPHAVLGDRYRLINNVCLAKESSVVVSAQGVRDNLKYMITFFLCQEHYDVERGLYGTAPLKGLVPRAHMYDEADPLHGPDGSPLPRAIVLERGETVGEWVARRQPDANVKAEVLRHIALRVRALHDAGYVHCNLSPDAFKWYPRENRWMLCEFGHAARAGDPRRAGAGGLSDTKITYAAPEGVAIDDRTASLKLRNDVVAKVPLDVWSYAVVALEVMFGTPLLDSSNEAEVRAQLGNQTPLPWEDERMHSIIVSSLGESYASLLFEALQRTASERPSMATLHDSWRSVQRKLRMDQEQDQSASDLL